MLMALFRLLAFGALIVLLLVVLLRRPAGSPEGRRRAREACPSCHAAIRVPPDDPGACPACGAPLVRSPGGKLRIRAN